MKNLNKLVRLYDNGGKTFDRYTAVYMNEPEYQPNTAAREKFGHFVQKSRECRVLRGVLK